MIRWIACGFGTGYVPRIPGTVGSLLGVALAAALSPLPLFHLGVIVVVFALLAIWVADRALPGFDKSDPSQIVIDEVAGYLVTVFGHPWSWPTAVIALLLFRVFDIAKPPPCRQVERWRGGLGIVADDLLAGIYANVALWIVAWWVAL